MEIGYLNEVKAILKSLVISSPDPISVDKLNRDYREIEGEFIPFRRLGYNNLEMFLRSISDTLLILGSGRTASVYFVANDKSMHIHNMIMQQKKPKGRPRAKSMAQSSYYRGNETHTPQLQRAGRTNNQYQATNMPRRTMGQQLSPFQITNRNVSTRTVVVREVPPNRTQLNVNSAQQRQVPTNATRSANYALPQPKGIDMNFSSNDNKQKQELKKPIENNIKPSHTQEQTRQLKIDENGDTLERSKKCQEEIKLLENLLSSTCHVKAPESPPLKSVMKSVTKTNFCGRMPTEALLDIQSRRTKVMFSLENKKSANEPDSKCINPNNADKGQKTYEDDIGNLAAEIKHESKVDKFKKMFDISDLKVVDLDEAIPEFAANNQVFRVDFPKHTVPYGRKIPSYKVPDTIEVGSCIGIFIAEIHNPFKFWFHIHKDEHELDILMNQIERFYTSLAANDLRIPIMCLNPGQVCAACYNDMWHRAEIVAPPVDNKIKVSFVDYGTVSVVNIMEIKYLASWFAQLPAQALRGSLSHIKPRGLHWSHEATLHFLSSVSELMLFAKMTEIDRENLIFHMILCDTHGDEVIQINTDLVAKRLAVYNEDWQENKIKKNNGRRNHHPREDYPTFSMIESGEYPSYSELVELNHRGIDYELIHDRIIFNKCSVLNFHDNVPEQIRQLPFFLQTTNPFRTDILLELTGTNAKI